MRVPLWFPVMAIGLTLTVVSCGSPPDTAVEDAKAAVENAAAQGAERYAAESFRAAQNAQAAMDAELAVQERQWLPSYERVKVLAAEAKSAGDNATADAIVARETADADVLTGIVHGPAGRVAETPTAAMTGTADAAAGAAIKPAALRPGGKIKRPVNIHDVKPVYPEFAKSARVEGQVVVRATIGRNGKVVGARVVRSVPLLDQAALDAVRQWTYSPPRLNGSPVPVVMTVRVNFTLS